MRLQAFMGLCSVAKEILSSLKQSLHCHKLLVQIQILRVLWLRLVVVFLSPKKALKCVLTMLLFNCGFLMCLAQVKVGVYHPETFFRMHRHKKFRQSKLFWKELLSDVFLMRCIHRPVLWLLHFNPFIHELYITTHVEPPPLYCCIVTDNFAEGISEILQTIKEIKNEHSHVNHVKLTCPENSDENPVPLPMATRTFLKIISWYLGEKKIQVKKRKKAGMRDS